MPDQNGSARNVGKVVEIKGVVIDAVFTDRLPAIYTALRIDIAALENIHLGQVRPPGGEKTTPLESVCRSELEAKNL